MIGLVQFINEARVGALSVSKLNELFTKNINSVCPELKLGSTATNCLDLKIYTKDGQEFRAYEAHDGDSSLTGYYNIPEQFITDKNNRYVGDYMQYAKLKTQQKKDFVEWLRTKTFELYVRNNSFYVVVEKGVTSSKLSEIIGGNVEEFKIMAISLLA